MMRKDVRIGFAIGGVLLAVLIVYGLVTSGPTPRNHEVTLAPDDPAAKTSNAKQPGTDNLQAGNGAQAPTPVSNDSSRGADAGAGNAPSPRGNQNGAGADNGSVAAN